jgi:MFS transporter, putative metabolite:H+ symporter
MVQGSHLAWDSQAILATELGPVHLDVDRSFLTSVVKYNNIPCIASRSTMQFGVGGMDAVTTPLLQQNGAGSIIARIERLPIGWWQIQARLIVGTATFFDAFDVLAIATTIPVLMHTWNLSQASIGPIISAAFIGQLLGAFLFGWVAEKYGRMQALTASVLVFSIMSAVCACAWDAPSLTTFRFLQGIGLGGEVPIAASYINEISRAHNRGRFFILYELTFSLGLALTGVIAAFIVPWLGWRAMFAVGAVPALLALVLRRALPESPRWLAEQGRLTEADAVMTGIEKTYLDRGTVLPPPVLLPTSPPREKKTHLSELFRTPYLRRTLGVWGLWFCAYFSYYGLATWLPTIYRSVFDLDLRTAYLLGSASAIIGFVGHLLCALFIDRVGRRIWFSAAFLLGFLGFIALWLLGKPSVPVLFFFITSTNLFLNTTNVALYLYTPEIYPTRLRAIGASLASAWLRIASAVGPILVGLVMAGYGLPEVFLMFGGTTLVGGVIAMFFTIETRERVLEEISQ